MFAALRARRFPLILSTVRALHIKEARRREGARIGAEGSKRGQGNREDDRVESEGERG